MLVKNNTSCHAERFLFSISASFSKQRDPEQRHLRMTRCGAFTLIELLVVVLIIGILSAIALPMYQVTVAKSHFAQVRIQARALAEAEARYYMENDRYTSNIEELDIDFAGTPTKIESGVGEKTYFFEQWTCSLATEQSWGDPRIVCKILSLPIAITYPLFTNTVKPQRRCVVETGSGDWSTGDISLAHKVCKAETGKNKPDTGNYYYY